MCRKSNKELDAWMEAEVKGYKDSQQKIPVTKLIREMLSLFLSKISQILFLGKTVFKGSRRVYSSVRYGTQLLL